MEKGGDNMSGYAERLEQLERLAYQGGFGADWLEDVGENVKFYAIACEQRGVRPTFKGLVDHIEALWRKADLEAKAREGTS